MSEFDKTAHPQFSLDAWSKPYITGGITIRQHAVLMAMQGLLASEGTSARDLYIAAEAIQYADAVLRAERDSREPDLWLGEGE